MGRNLSGKISYGQFWRNFSHHFFLDIKFKICTLCWGGGGMIGGGGCRIRNVTWMDGQGSILQGTSGCLPHVVAS